MPYIITQLCLRHGEASEIAEVISKAVTGSSPERNKNPGKSFPSAAQRWGYYCCATGAGCGCFDISGSLCGGGVQGHSTVACQEGGFEDEAPGPVKGPQTEGGQCCRWETIGRPAAQPSRTWCIAAAGNGVSLGCTVYTCRLGCRLRVSIRRNYAGCVVPLRSSP